MPETDVTKLDIYLLLDVPEEADEAQVKRAFRRKALTCHPDKNPDDPKAAQQFRDYSKAAEILLDPSARDAYDKVRRARKERDVRSKQLDGKRRKLKDDLEAREKGAYDREQVVNEALKLAQEIERLRREGSKRLEEENEFIRIQLEEERRLEREAREHGLTGDLARLRVKWKKHLHDENSLRSMFQKYGQITVLVVSKKGNSALIEFDSKEAAERAFNSNLSSDSITVSWVQPDVAHVVHSTDTAKETISGSNFNFNFIPETRKSVVEPESLVNENDFESLVLMKLRRAQERKRLVEQMEKREKEPE